MVGVVCLESLVGQVCVWPLSYVIYAVSMLGLGSRLLEKLGRLGTKLVCMSPHGRSCLSRVSGHVWLAVSMQGLGSRPSTIQIKEYRNFCEMKASIFVLHITLSTNQKAQKQV